MRHRNVKALVGLAAILLVATAACKEKPKPVLEEPKFRADGVLDFIAPDGALITRIAIEIAESEEAKTEGLMRRRSLPTRGGMLFVYEQPGQRSFWMKNTPLPLDIIFLNGDSSIVSISRRTRPLSQDEIKSAGPALHVLEVRAGFTERHGIDESTRIAWRRGIS